MSRKINVKKIVFGIVVSIQFFVVAIMIFRYEIILTKGESFKFVVEPFDPVDFFRGRYMNISVKNLEFEGQVIGLSRAEKKRYVVFAKDENGYAVVKNISAKKPDSENYLYIEVYKYGHNIRVEIPFTQYYLNENVAPEAEKFYNKHARKKDGKTFIDLRIYKGKGVIEYLYIDNKKVEELLTLNP